MTIVLFARLGYTGISIVVVLIIIALIVDTSIVSIATSTGGLISSLYDIALFVIMSVIFAGGQYIILGFIKHQYKDRVKIGGLRTNSKADRKNSDYSSICFDSNLIFHYFANDIHHELQHCIS